MADQFGIKLSVKVTDLRASINDAIQKINESGKLKKIKLPVDTKDIENSIKRIKTELQSITGKSVAPKIQLGTSRADGQVTLDEVVALKKAEEELAKPKGLAAVQIELNKTSEIIKALTNTVSKFKAELRGISADNLKNINTRLNNAGNSTKSSNKSTAEKEITKKKKVQEDVAKAAEVSAQKEISAEKNVSTAIKQTNELYKIREKIIRETGSIYSSETRGNAVNSVTKNYKDNSLLSTVVTTNYYKQRQEQERNYTYAAKLSSKLEEIRAKYSDINGIKPITNTDNLKKLSTQYNLISDNIKKIASASSETTAKLKADTDSQIAELERLVKQYQNVEYAATSLRTKDIATVKMEQGNTLDRFAQKIISSRVPISALDNDIKNLRTSLSNVTDKSTLVEYLNQFDILSSKFDVLNNKAKNTVNISKLIEKNINGLDKILDNTALYRSRGYDSAKYSGLISSVDILKNKYIELQNSFKTDNSADNLAKTKTQLVILEEELKKVGLQAANLKKEFNGIKIDENSSRKIAQTLALINSTMNGNAAAMGKINTLSGSGLTFREEFEQLKYSLQSSPELVDQINGKVRTLQANIKALGFEGNTILGDFKEKAIKFIKWTGMTMLVTKARMYIRQLFTTVYELDTALIDLRKTFNGTNAELESFYYESNKIAKQMGVTTQEIIQQGSAWSRLGYSTNEAMKKMTEMSSMLAAISPDMNVEEAQNGLVSIMKAFDIAPNDVLDGILSKVNIIGNTAATSNGEIVTMLEKSSSAMKEANNTLEQTIALETAAVEVTRDAESVGTAFKTISMRIRGYDEETLEYIGDVEELSGKIADLTKTASKPSGISLFTDESKTTYKSTYQLLKDISEIYNELSDKQQAGLLEALAGKRQGQIIAATLSNFKAAEKALVDMENSAGSAEAEMDVIRESAEYAFNTLKETFTSLAQHSVSRGGLKDLINAGTKILEIVDGVVSKIGLIPTIITTITGMMTAKKLNAGNGIFGKNADGKYTIFGSQINGGFKSWLSGLGKTTPEIREQKNEIQNATAAINQYHNAYQKKIMTEQIGNNVLNNSNKIVRDYGNAIRNGASETDAYVAAQSRINRELKNISVNGKAAGTGAKRAGLGIKVLNTAASMAISMGISAALNLAVKAISDSVNAVQNHIDKIKELTEKENSLKAEINDLNKQLSTTKLRISELEKQPKLTLLEQDELDRLKEANDELERQLRLKRGELGKTASDKNKEAEQLWKTMTSTATARLDWYDFVPGVNAVGAVIDGISDISNFSQGNFLEQQIADLDTYEKKLKELAEFKQSEEFKKGDEEANKRAEKMQEEIDKYHDTVQKYYNNQWARISTGLDPSYNKNKEALQTINKLMGRFEKLNEKSATTFENLYNDSKYAVVKQYLEDLAKNGELTAEAFETLTDKEVEGIEDFKKALKSIPNANAKNVVEAIEKAIKNAGEKADEATGKIKGLAEALDILKEKIDGVISKQKKLAEAYKKTGLGQKLSAEETYELIKEVPDIAKYLEKEGNAFSISQEGYREANQKLYHEIQKKISEDVVKANEQKKILEEIKSLYDEQIEFTKEHGKPLASIQEKYSKLIDDYKTQYNITDNDALTKNIDETLKEVENEYEGFSAIHQLMNDIFDERKIAIDAINEGFKTSKEEIDKYNTNIKNIDQAIENLKKDGALSYDEMNSIIELAPELQDSFEQQENGYSIVESALDDLRKKSLETRNKYISDLIAEAKAEKEAAEISKKANQEKCGYIDEYGKKIEGTLKGVENYVAKLQAEAEVEIAKSQISALDKIIQQLEGLQKDILSPSDNTSISDEMQELIDYYNTIISAVEIVKNKYTDVIDEEINALNDSKDALKEANDERQRELDLIDARNNLENAKKRKVWVYSEGKGFQQVQDEKAVKEAEEKYRKAIQDVQEAEIDKQISEKEKQKKALDDKVKDLTELEGDINDNIKVAQALKALGLSNEKDLLDLSDDVKKEIKDGLANAIIQKGKEDNKDNSNYTPVTLDDVLSHLGANVSSKDIERLGLVTKQDFDNAVKGFTDSLKEYQEQNVNNVVNNNSGMVVSPTFNISGVTDPKEVAKVVNTEMTNLFTKINNSIK